EALSCLHLIFAVAFQPLRLFFQNCCTRTGRIDARLGRKSLIRNGAVAFEGEQVICSSRRVVGRTEDLVLIFPERLNPRAYVGGVLRWIVRDAALGGEENARQFRAQLFFGIIQIAKSVAFVQCRTIEAATVATVMGKRMEKGAVVSR